MKTQEKNEANGKKKYDKFVKKVLGHNEVMTPRADTVEKLGLLKESSTSFMQICLEELLENFKNYYDLRVEEGTLYKVYKTEKLERYKYNK